MTGVAGGALLLVVPGAGDDGHNLDMRGRPVESDATGATRNEVSAADIGERLVVPSVDLDVAVGSIEASGGVVVPPTFTSAYVIDDLSPEVTEDGTTFIAMHSLRNGGLAPGNFLIDIDTGRATVGEGDAVLLGDDEYRVTGSEEIPKGALASATEVWRNAPGRLVLITCLQRSGGGASLENIVIYAERAAS